MSVVFTRRIQSLLSAPVLRPGGLAQLTWTAHRSGDAEIAMLGNSNRRAAALIRENGGSGALLETLMPKRNGAYTALVVLHGTAEFENHELTAWDAAVVGPRDLDEVMLYTGAVVLALRTGEEGVPMDGATLSIPTSGFLETPRLNGGEFTRPQGSPFDVADHFTTGSCSAGIYRHARSTEARCGRAPRGGALEFVLTGSHHDGSAVHEAGRFCVVGPNQPLSSTYAAECVLLNYRFGE